jgi:hypothetical protein
MMMALVLLLALSLSTPAIGVNVTVGLLTSDQSENLIPLQMAGNLIEEWNCFNLEVHCFLLNILLVDEVNENLTVLPNVNLQLEVWQLSDSSDRRQMIRIIEKILDSGVVTTFTPESFCEFVQLVANVYSKKITISHVS